jgi:hypothetical protein
MTRRTLGGGEANERRFTSSSGQPPFVTDVTRERWSVMRTIRFRTLSMGALALLTFSGGVAAQTPPPAVLNTLEVRQLVERAEPGDHARLGAHFAAIAERYTVDARRHTAMSKAIGGNPNRQLATGSSARYTRLAELDTQSAATLRELAVHHERLAAGTPSTVPLGSARFEDGKGAPAPTDRELNALAARARTPAEHRALEEYFMTLAARHTKKATEHTAMAQAYRGNANRRGGDPAVHCDRMTRLSREAAEEARGAAAEHGHWATIG